MTDFVDALPKGTSTLSQDQTLDLQDDCYSTEPWRLLELYRVLTLGSLLSPNNNYWRSKVLGHFAVLYFFKNNDNNNLDL